MAVLVPIKVDLYFRLNESRPVQWTINDSAGNPAPLFGLTFQLVFFTPGQAPMYLYTMDSSYFTLIPPNTVIAQIPRFITGTYTTYSYGLWASDGRSLAFGALNVGESVSTV
jgi:hypothetical protein